METRISQIQNRFVPFLKFELFLLTGSASLKLHLAKIVTDM